MAHYQFDQNTIRTLCARKQALALEMKGLRNSRRRSVYATCQRVYKFKGSRQQTYEQLCKLIEDVESRKVVLVHALPI